MTGTVKLKYANQEISLNAITEAPKSAVSKGVKLNYRLMDLTPFNGGLVEIAAALVSRAWQQSPQRRCRHAERFLFADRGAAWASHPDRAKGPDRDSKIPRRCQWRRTFGASSDIHLGWR
ncbi:hypothetical protein [Bradyrhizobium sp. NAS80.1]|uniref:hypothetical protein n=1 Tax=Bradyrhizobium sp. NAS80.1 TaxID=1680159 RepID=UPI0011612B5E|nr:hypothetical protein [Bradyrhizobium sp. NAS80.1]